MPDLYSKEILQSGFTPDLYCFQDTIIGFDYDVHNTSLTELNSPFEPRIKTHRNPNDLNELLICDLQLKKNMSLTKGIKFLKSVWHLELSYQSDSQNRVELDLCKNHAVLHCLTISDNNAMTVKFIISHGKDTL